MLYAIVGLLVVILDQAVKYWVSFHVDLESTGNVLIPGVLSLVNVHNDGVAFGFLAGSNARIPLIIITGVFLLIVVIALATKFIPGRFARWCLVLVAAGGFSNCIDRVIYGYVQDMFKCELFNFPVFNVADIFISVFAILFALAVIFERKTVYDDDYLDDYDDDYDEEDDYEEEEEPERPARKSRRPLLSRRKSRRDDYDDEEEEEEEEEEDEEPEPEPVKPARKSRKERAEEDYLAARRVKEARAEEKAPAKAEPAPKAEPKPAAKKAAQSEDPFAAWEQANARVAAQSARQNAARGLPASAPAPKAEPKSEPRPAPKAEPRPAAKKPAPAEEEFSLEDILAEFK